MKTKVKLIVTLILVVITIIISNLGQLLLSDEQFIKEESSSNLKQ